MTDIGQEALEEMNRLLLNQQRLKMKLERMGDNQIADLSKKVHILNEANMKLENALGQFAEDIKKVERLQEQLNEANDCINSAQISLRGYMLKINEYKKKWGVK